LGVLDFLSLSESILALRSIVLQTLARWYLAFIEYEVGIKNQPKLYGAGFQNTVHLGQEIIEMLEEAIHRQPDKALAQSQITALVVAAQLLFPCPGTKRGYIGFHKAGLKTAQHYLRP
jgi:hypothetical protein